MCVCLCVCGVGGIRHDIAGLGLFEPVFVPFHQIKSGYYWHGVFVFAFSVGLSGFSGSQNIYTKRILGHDRHDTAIHMIPVFRVL